MPFLLGFKISKYGIINDGGTEYENCINCP